MGEKTLFSSKFTDEEIKVARKIWNFFQGLKDDIKSGRNLEKLVRALYYFYIFEKVQPIIKERGKKAKKISKLIKYFVKRNRLLQRMLQKRLQKITTISINTPNLPKEFVEALKSIKIYSPSMKTYKNTSLELVNRFLGFLAHSLASPGGRVEFRTELPKNLYIYRKYGDEVTYYYILNSYWATREIFNFLKLLRKIDPDAYKALIEAINKGKIKNIYQLANKLYNQVREKFKSIFEEMKNQKKIEKGLSGWALYEKIKQKRKK